MTSSTFPIRPDRSSYGLIWHMCITIMIKNHATRVLKLSVYSSVWKKLLLLFSQVLWVNLTNSQLITLQESSKHTLNRLSPQQVFNSRSLTTSIIDSFNSQQNSQKSRNSKSSQISNSNRRRYSQRQTPNRCPIQCTCTNGIQIECSTAKIVSMKNLLDSPDFGARTVEQLKLPRNNITHLLENDLVVQMKKLKRVL